MIQRRIHLPEFPRGFHLITDIILNNIGILPNMGMLFLFIQHTSAGLCINENYDPEVRLDFETYFNSIVPENMQNIKHTSEGPDDMPAHIKSVLAGHSLSIPVFDGKLGLGIWQGIYLCEFRNHGGSRKILATLVE